MKSWLHVTGSKLHRVWQCPASAALPQDVDPEAEARTEPFRRVGSEVHGFLEAASLPTFDREEELGKLSPEAHKICDALDLQAMPIGMSTEVAIAWDWRKRTARELGRNLGHRDYASLPTPPTADEIPFTADVMGVIPGRRPKGFGGDYKVGHTRYPRPKEFGQVMLVGLALRALYGCEESQLQTIRISDDGEAFVAVDEVDEWLLDAFADEVEQAMSWLQTARSNAISIEEISGMAHPGAHCDYCPAFRHCPSHALFLREMPHALVTMGVRRSEADVLALDPGAITAAKAAAFYLAAERFEELMRQVKSEVCKLGWHFPIELPDGRVIEPRTSTRRELKNETVLAVLTERYGVEQALQAFSTKTSIEAVKRVVVANKTPGRPITSKKGSGAFDEVETEIGRRGGIETRTTETCKPYVQRRSLPVSK